MIIAAVPALKKAYVLPAQRLFHQIQAQFPHQEVVLPDRDNVIASTINSAKS